jgi:hypothetical protein
MLDVGRLLPERSHSRRPSTSDDTRPSSRRAPAERTPAKSGIEPFTERESVLVKFALAHYRHQIGVRGKPGAGSGFDTLTPEERESLAELAATRARQDKPRITVTPA